MFCPNCGETNPDEARFCGKCGRTMPAAAPAAQPAGGGSAAAAQPAPAAPSSAVTPGMKWGMFAASILFFPLGIGMGWMYMRDADPQKKTAGRLWFITGIVMAVIAVLYQCANESGSGY